MNGVTQKVKWFKVGAVSMKIKWDSKLFKMAKHWILDYSQLRLNFNFNRGNVQSNENESVTFKVGISYEIYILFEFMHRLQISLNCRKIDLRISRCLKRHFDCNPPEQIFKWLLAIVFAFAICEFQFHGLHLIVRLMHNCGGKLYFNVSIWNFYHYSVVKKKTTKYKIRQYQFNFLIRLFFDLCIYLWIEYGNRGSIVCVCSEYVSTTWCLNAIDSIDMYGFP